MNEPDTIPDGMPVSTEPMDHSEVEESTEPGRPPVVRQGCIMCGKDAAEATCSRKCAKEGEDEFNALSKQEPYKPYKIPGCFVCGLEDEAEQARCNSVAGVFGTATTKPSPRYAPSTPRTLQEVKADIDKLLSKDIEIDLDKPLSERIKCVCSICLPDSAEAVDLIFDIQRKEAEKARLEAQDRQERLKARYLMAHGYDPFSRKSLFLAGELAKAGQIDWLRCQTPFVPLDFPVSQKALYAAIANASELLVAAHSKTRDLLSVDTRDELYDLAELFRESK